MPITQYDEALKQVKALSASEQERLLAEIESSRGQATPEATSILELRGLGKEIWEGADSDEYLKQERNSWDR